MLQGCLGSHVLELGQGRAQKGAAGSGQNQSLNFISPAGAQTLMKRTVLAIDGEKRDPLFARRLRYQLSGHDECFFIGEADRFAGSDCLVCRLHASHAVSGGDHNINFGVNRSFDMTRRPGKNLDALATQARPKWLNTIGVRDGDNLRLKFPDLFCQQLDISACRQRNDPEAAGQAPHYAQRVLTD
jgi:hypothetical protein